MFFHDLIALSLDDSVKGTEENANLAHAMGNSFQTLDNKNTAALNSAVSGDVFQESIYEYLKDAGVASLDLNGAVPKVGYNNNARVTSMEVSQQRILDVVTAGGLHFDHSHAALEHLREEADEKYVSDDDAPVRLLRESFARTFSRTIEQEKRVLKEE